MACLKDLMILGLSSCVFGLLQKNAALAAAENRHVAFQLEDKAKTEPNWQRGTTLSRERERRTLATE